MTRGSFDSGRRSTIGWACMSGWSPLSLALIVFAGAALASPSDKSPDARASSLVSPIYGVRLPGGYRSWHLISVAHEAGKNNDFRAILGNGLALAAFRSGKRPFPDGAAIVRIAWRYEPSPRNDAVFPAPQSFVAGDPINVQVSVKNARRYGNSGGWGFGQFEEGKPNPDAALIRTCAPCHAKLGAADDMVFTRYAR